MEAGKGIKLEMNAQLGYYFRVTKKVRRAVSLLKMAIGFTFENDPCSIIQPLRGSFQDEKKLRQHPGFSIIDARNNGVRFRSSRLNDSNDSFLELKADYNEHQKNIVEEIMKIAGEKACVFLYRKCVSMFEWRRRKGVRRGGE